MDFLKKNYMKIFFTSITLAGVAMFIVLLANFDSLHYGVGRNAAIGVEGGPDNYNALGFLFLYISAFIFFTLVTATIIMSMFEKTKNHVKWVIFSTGVLGLTFMLCSALLPLKSDSYGLMREIRNGERNTQIQQYVQAETVQAAFAVIGANELIFIFTSAPMDEWHDQAQSLYNLSGDMTGEELAELKEALDEIKEVIKKQTALAIGEAKDRAAYDYLQNTIVRVTILLIFGSLPLVYGLKLILIKEEKPERSEHGN